MPSLAAKSVGYGENALIKSGNKMLTAQFLAIAMTEGATDADGKPLDGYPINSLIPISSTEEVPSDKSIRLMRLDSIGNISETFVWRDAVEENIFDASASVTYKGWYKGSVKATAADVISKGEGLWVSCNDDNVSIQASGKVRVKDVAFELVVGNRAIANPFPTSIKINDITPVLKDSTVADKSIRLMRLDSNGNISETFVWRDAVEENIFDASASVTYKGWYRGSVKATDSDLLLSGDGLWTSCEQSGVYLQVPASSIE